MTWQTEWIKAWYVVCSRCGATTAEWFGWSEGEAISLAIDLGWREGLCENCLGEIEEERRVAEEQLKQLRFWSGWDRGPYWGEVGS